MPEQSATNTQEEKRRVSPEEILNTLRKHRDRLVEQASEDADLLEYLTQNYDKPPLDAEQRRVRIANARQEAAALEQAIALVEEQTPLREQLHSLEEALIETSAHADWLWLVLQSAGVPERFWKDQSQAMREGYRLAARKKLAEKGLVTP